MSWLHAFTPCLSFFFSISRFHTCTSFSFSFLWSLCGTIGLFTLQCIYHFFLFSHAPFFSFSFSFLCSLCGTIGLFTLQCIYHFFLCSHAPFFPFSGQKRKKANVKDVCFFLFSKTRSLTEEGKRRSFFSLFPFFLFFSSRTRQQTKKLSAD